MIYKGLKRCSKCKKLLTIAEFHKSKNRKDYLCSYCKECVKKYRQSDKGKNIKGAWVRSERGKVSKSKSNAKRRRNLNFILLFDNPFKCPVHYHHISDAFVVAIPRDVHFAHLGQGHRTQLKPLVELLYNISYTIV